jgi:hypothetical protein
MKDDTEMYLLLNLKTLNRKEDFVTKLPKYNEIGINIKDINLKGIVESYIEYNEPDTVEIDEYRPGLILKAKGSNIKNYYSSVVVSVDRPHNERTWEYYLLNLETLQLTPVFDFEDIINDYETFKDFNYTDLLLRIN